MLRFRNVISLVGTIRWLLIILLISVPFVYSRSTFEFIGTPKEIFVFAILISCVLATLLSYLYAGELRLRKSPLNYFVLALVLWSGLVFIFSLNKNLAFFGDPNSFGSFYHFIIYGILYFLCLQYLGTDFNKNHLTVLSLVTFLMGIVDLVLVLSFAGLFTAPAYFIGSYNNFLFFAGLVLVSFVLLYIFYFNLRSKLVNFLTGVLVFVSFLLVLLVSFYNILLWVALFAAFSLAFIIVSFVSGIMSNRLKFFLLFVMSALSLLVILTPFSLKRTLSVHLNKFIKSQPTELNLTHRYSYDLALRSIKDYPFFGQGFGQFPFYYEFKKEPAVYSTDFGGITFNQSANVISQLLIESGLVFALTFYGMLVFTLFYLFKKIINSDKSAVSNGISDLSFGNSTLSLVIVILSYFLMSTIFTNYTFTQGVFLFAILGIVGGSVAKIGIIEIRLDNRNKKLAANLIILAVMLAFTFLLVSEARSFVSSWYLRKVASAQSLEDRLDYLNKAYSFVDYDDLIAREISLTYLNLALEKIKSLGENLSSNKSNTKTMEIFNYLQNAIAYSKRAIQLNPSNYLNYQLAGFIYESIIGYVEGSFGEALKYYNSALSYSGNNPEINYYIARSYYRQILFYASGKKINELPQSSLVSSYIARSEAILKKALEIRPFFVEAYNLLGDLSILANQPDKAIQNYSNSAFLNPNPQIYYQLGLLYWQNNDLTRAKENLLRSVELFPDYSDARYILALIYNQENNYTEALRHLEAIAKHNKDNQFVNNMIADIKKKLGI